MYRTEILRGAFPDAAMLERLCDRLVMSGAAGEAFAARADEDGLRHARRAGLPEAQLAGLGGTDLLLCVQANDPAKADAALSVLRSAALVAHSQEEGYRYTNPCTAADAFPGANFACVGVPQRWAARVTEQCLQRGLGVMLSSGLSFEEEQRLKKLAAEADLPLLGSGVAGALLAGQPLGACPPLRRGGVAVLGPSFSANLVCALLLERGGAGVRHLLSTGRRDCFAEEGGAMTRSCLSWLAEDPQTEAVALVLKTGDFGVLTELAATAKQLGKPAFVYGVNALKSGAFGDAAGAEASLARLADRAARALGGEGFPFLSDEEAEQRAAPYRAGFARGQELLRGLFLSETMCGEVAAPLLPALGAVYSNRPVRSAHRITDLRFLKGNCVIDFGAADVAHTVRASFETPVARNRRLVDESYNKTVALLLADWYGGAGCTEEYLADLAAAVSAARENARRDGRSLAVGVVAITGEGSPVGKQQTFARLREAGAEVFESADDAVLFASKLLPGEGLKG